MFNNIKWCFVHGMDRPRRRYAFWYIFLQNSREPHSEQPKILNDGPVEQLPDTAQDHASNLPLNAFSGLHKTLVGADEQTLANLSHTLDELCILSSDNLSKLITVEPNALGGFGKQLHLPQNRLAIPVLHAQP